MATYFLGIDGGASAGKWSLIDSGGIEISCGVDAAIDGHIYKDESRRHLSDFLEKIEPNLRDHVSGVHCGLTGISTNSDTRELELLISSIFTKSKVSVEQDVVLGYRSHFENKEGIFLYAGTGSVAITMKDGKYVDVGGWGYLLGDEGGGYWIAIQGLRHLLFQFERIEKPTKLSMSISNLIDCHNWDDVREFVYSRTRSEIAKLARLVIENLDKDEAADAIINSATQELAELVRRAISISHLPDPEIYFGGGIARSHPTIKSRVEKALNRNIKISTEDYSRAAAEIARNSYITSSTK